MTVKNLGEIALRTKSLALMRRFYEEIVGLEVIRADELMVFLKIGDGYAGHTQVVALFLDTNSPDFAEESYAGQDRYQMTLHHLAFSIALEDFEAEKTRLESLGIAVRTSTHAWVQWRSLYIEDPEGNTVEFVCYDASVG